MKIVMYGIRSCHDCVDAVKLLDEKKIAYEYRDFAADAIYLKEFLLLREHADNFDFVRDNDYIGIPYFELEDGTKTFDVNEVVAKAQA